MSSSAERTGTTAEPGGAEATVLRLATAMLRPALRATPAVGLLTLVGAAVLRGLPGVLGSLLGTLLVVGLFWVNIAVMRRTAASRPRIVLGAVVGGHLAKVLVLLALFPVLARIEALDVRAFGVSVMAAVAVWTGAELLGFVRARVSTVTISNASVSSS